MNATSSSIVLRVGDLYVRKEGTYAFDVLDIRGEVVRCIRKYFSPYYLSEDAWFTKDSLLRDIKEGFLISVEPEFL